MELLRAGLRAGTVAVALFVGFIVPATAQEKAKEPTKVECPNCATIATDYGKAWEDLQVLLNEESALLKKAEEARVDFQKAYFGGDQAELDRWAKDAAATPQQLAELPARIEKARKEVDERHDVLLDCLRLNCFSVEQRPPPPSDAGKLEECKACVDGANRVADMAALLVLLIEIGTELETKIPLQATVLQEAETAHDKDTDNPALVVVQKERELHSFLQNQRDTLRDTIKVLDEQLGTAQTALDECREQKCALKATAPVTPPPRPPPPACTECDALAKRIAASRAEVTSLTSVRETFRLTKAEFDKSAQQGVLQPADKPFLEQATKRLDEIDADLKRLDDEIASVSQQLGRCNVESCVGSSETKVTKPPPAAKQPLTQVIENALKKLGGKTQKRRK